MLALETPVETFVEVSSDDVWSINWVTLKPGRTSARGEAVVALQEVEKRDVPDGLENCFAIDDYIGVFFTRHEVSDSPIHHIRTVVYVPRRDCIRLT